MPASVTQSGNTTGWTYSPDHERTQYTSSGRTTWYLNPGVHQGAHYERTDYASGTTEHRHTIYGGGKPIGEVLTFDGGAPSQTRYFHSDHQGTITAVTDQTGAVITRYRYDPWGKQTLVSGSNTGIDATRQGHTGHEMLDSGLTHMNGRVYDPTLSRFVSADPIVDNPFDLQSLNRYSYVMNNPLYYTDPTGFSSWTDFRDGFLKPVVSIAAAAFLPGSSFFTSLGLTGLTGQIAAGAIAGSITGGGRGALMGAVSAGMFSQLHGMSPGIGKVLAHGVAGGMMSEMQGGSFKSGFLAAGFTQGASQLGLFNNLGDPSTWNGRAANAVGAAVVGGTASVIGGGKFANGAMTGAFSRLFNDLQCKGKVCWAEKPTLDEMNKHWRDGDGRPVYVNGANVDLSYIPKDKFPDVGDRGAIGDQLGVVLGRGDGRLYGSLTVNRTSETQVLILPDTYDFLPHEGSGVALRNAATYAGFYRASRAGGNVGADFKVIFYGQTPITEK